jgi:hypothetical protein
MSVRVMSAVWDNGPSNYIDRYVLLCIADIGNDDGYGYPSVATVVAKTRLSKRTVLRSIQSLEENGWVIVNRKSRKVKFSTYEIQLDRFQKSGDSQSPKKSKKSGDSRDTSQVTLSPESGDSQSTVPHTPYMEEPLLNHEINPPAKTASEKQGERCYKAYPKKTAPAAGMQAFTALIETLVRKKRFASITAAGDWVFGRVIEFANSPCVTTQRERFWPRADRWVKEGRYDENFSLWQTSGFIPRGDDTPEQGRSQLAEILLEERRAA